MSPSRLPNRSRLTLPRWTTHPAFGVAALLAVAVLLIAHGEPQPSSRPSGKSVVASGAPTAPTTVPAVIVIRDQKVQYRLTGALRTIALPDRAIPTSVITNRGLSVVLATVADRQVAYAIGKSFKPIRLGPADAVLPATNGTSAVIIERALSDPGRLPPTAPSSPTKSEHAPSKSSSSASSRGSAVVGSGAASSASASTSSTKAAPPTRDYTVRRYNAAGAAIGPAVPLPPGMRAATDTAVGLVVWRPLKQLFDGLTQLEPLSAQAALLRPDRTLRYIGPMHPLAANGTDLLVWDVATEQFGVMPLRYVTSTATTTATPTSPADGSAASGASSTESSAGAGSSGSTAIPSASTIVAGTTWFEQSRAITVTGPASFSPDGRSFAVYSQVGDRRRLVVGQVAAVPAQQSANPLVNLALDPAASPANSGSASTQPTTSARSSIGTSAAGSATGSGSSASAEPPSQFSAEGFPVTAPLQPEWWGTQVIALGTDGVLLGYQPGENAASVLDIGITAIDSIASAP